YHQRDGSQHPSRTHRGSSGGTYINSTKGRGGIYGKRNCIKRSGRRVKLGASPCFSARGVNVPKAGIGAGGKVNAVKGPTVVEHIGRVRVGRVYGARVLKIGRG